MSRDLTKAAASASAGAAVMIRRVVRLRRGLLYAHLRHDLSTASRDSGAARRRPLPRAMPRNAATAPATVPCRAPLRLNRLSRPPLLQEPVAGGGSARQARHRHNLSPTYT